MSDFFQVDDVHTANEILNDDPHDPLTVAVRVAGLITESLALRNQIKAAEARVTEIKEQRSQIDAQILEFLDSSGQESAKTSAGTAYVHRQDYASCSDADGFMQFVAHNNAYELLNRTPNSTACRAFADQHGHLPPGVKLNTQRTAKIRAPGGKS